MSNLPMDTSFWWFLRHDTNLSLSVKQVRPANDQQSRSLDLGDRNISPWRPAARRSRAETNPNNR